MVVCLDLNRQREIAPLRKHEAKCAVQIACNMAMPRIEFRDDVHRAKAALYPGVLPLAAEKAGVLNLKNYTVRELGN